VVLRAAQANLENNPMQSRGRHACSKAKLSSEGGGTRENFKGTGKETGKRTRLSLNGGNPLHRKQGKETRSLKHKRNVLLVQGGELETT